MSMMMKLCTSSSWCWMVVILFAFVMHETRAEILWSNVCGEEPMKGFPFCNTSLSWDERVLDYSHRIPTRQKIRMMIDTAAGVPALHIPPYSWWSEGLHGPLQPCVCASDHRDPESCRCPTSFPCPSALGNALNDTLWRRVGATIGRQARAINNVRRHHSVKRDLTFGGYDGLTYWSPTINLQRDPRWGRNMEVPGEDPLVVAHYAKEFVQGLQYGITTNINNNNQDAATTIHQVAACCKHLIANSLEGHPESNISRHDFNALVSPDDLANYYMPPFQACVEAGSLGLMCSYNAVNGLPSCANPSLLQDVVRHQWNFTGYIVSDCGALQDIVEGHHLGTNLTAAAALALQASTDLNCGIVYTSYLPQALASGFITPNDIDTSFRRLAKVQMQLGLFDHHSSSDSNPRHAFLNYGINDIDTPDDQQLALQAAQQSIVLLQNYNQTLPLQAPITKLAVIGPHIAARQVFMSNYHGERCLYGTYNCIPTPLATVRTANHGGTTVSSLGCHVKRKDLNNIDAAVELAKTADTIILFLGIDTSIEDEGLDRTETTLPGLQLKLLDRILELGWTQPQRLVVVLIHGGTLSLGADRLKRIPALLSAPYGGQAAAQAIADVLFGSYNPTGKLAATVYPPNYVRQIPITEMGLQVGVGRTHMYYKGPVEFSFGHGLSYSQWKLEWQDKGPLHWNVQSSPLVVNVTVTNQGPYPGAQTVLLLWRPKTVSSIRQKLIGFQGSSLLHVGERFEASFVVDAAALGVANSKGKKVVTPGKYTLVALSAGISTEINLVVSDSSNEWVTNLE